MLSFQHTFADYTLLIDILILSLKMQNQEQKIKYNTFYIRIVIKVSRANVFSFRKKTVTAYFCSVSEYAFYYK